MKSFTNFVLIALLTLAPTAIVSAFTTPGSFSSQRNVVVRTNLLQIGMARKSGGLGGKPAKSKEEDLELTHALIMDHMSVAKEVVEPVKEVGNLITEDAVSEDGGADAMGKIKNLGRKIKSKIQGKGKE